MPTWLFVGVGSGLKSGKCLAPDRRHGQLSGDDGDALLARPGRLRRLAVVRPARGPGGPGAGGDGGCQTRQVTEMMALVNGDLFGL
jgi:hypothetical protein